MSIDLQPPSRDGLLTGPFPMAPAAADDFTVRTGLPDGPVEVLAIELTEQIFVRKRRDVVLQAESGRVIADLDSDVALVSVVERYGKNSNRPTAFVAGFGIRSGALASSSAPDDNNIVVIGASPEDMAVGREPSRRPWRGSGGGGLRPGGGVPAPAHRRDRVRPRSARHAGRGGEARPGGQDLGVPGWTGRSCTCSSCPSPRSPTTPSPTLEQWTCSPWTPFDPVLGPAAP